MIQEFTDKHCYMRFDTFTEACSYSEANKDKSEAATRETERGYMSGNKKWSGTSTFQQAVDLSRTGYREGRKMIETFKTKLDAQLESTHHARQQVTFDVVGTGGFDMGEVLTGVPECAMEWEDTHIMDRRQSNSGRIVKFLVNLTASAMVSSDVLAQRGAVVGALVDCLEHEGYSVEIETAVTCDVRSWGSDTKHDGVFDIRTTLKQAGEHMQIDQLAFALVNPAFFRRFGFVHIATCGAVGKNAAENASYGTPRDIDPDQLTEEKVDLYFPMAHGYESQWNNPEAAISWLSDQLKLFGFDLKRK